MLLRTSPFGAPLVLALAVQLSACYEGLDAGLEPAPLPLDPSGTEGDAPTGGDSEPEADAVCPESEVAYVPMRRLTSTEYANTARDLFGVTIDPATLPVDEGFSGFASNPTEVTALAVHQYLDAAEYVATTAALSAIAACDPSETADACAERFVTEVGRRAFRRPLEAAEFDGLFELYAVKAEASGFEAGARLVLQALLQSPWFLYRPETSADADGALLAPLHSFELATRLSYFLWSSAPDDALLDAAAAGGLETADELEAHARRLLADPRAGNAVRSFHRQWLGLQQLGSIDKDPVLYAAFTPELRDAMEEETLLFAERVVSHGAGSFTDLLTAEYSFVNADLAELYGLEGGSDEFERRELPAGERAGVLTQASVLSSAANADQQSPIRRGKFVREQLLCQTIPEPPPDANVNPPEVDPDLPTRERYERHSTDALCAGCHQLMDPIGFGFLHYDAVGRWQDEENGMPIDAAGQLAGTEALDGAFEGALELGERLAQAPEVQRCAARQWTRFMLGRRERTSEECWIEEAAQTFADHDLDITELIVALVRAPTFRYRRTQEDEA